MKLRLCRTPLITMLLLLAGCAGANQEKAYTDEIGKDGFRLVSYTGTTRGAYIWPDGKAGHICAEPPPDLGLTTAREISANLKAAASALGAIGSPSLEAGGVAKLSSAAIELAGRSQLVLLTREFLYRDCELAANFGPGTTEYTVLGAQYGKVLDVVLELAKADRDRAAKDLLDAQIIANALERTQETKIDAFLKGVIKADGSVDHDKLVAVLSKAQINDTVKGALLTQTNREGLRRMLDYMSDRTIDALLAAQNS
jgi:hypothetical protein